MLDTKVALGRGNSCAAVQCPEFEPQGIFVSRDSLIESLERAQEMNMAFNGTEGDFRSPGPIGR